MTKIIKEVIVDEGHGHLDPHGLVIHSTSNPGATARNHSNYWKGALYTAHYVSDWIEALHTVNDSHLCYHCGNGNSRFIGLEICEAKNRDDFELGWNIAVKAAREILKKHGWSVKSIVSHDWCRRNLGGTTHTDPIGYFKKWGRTWDEFVHDVDEAPKSASTARIKTSGSRLMLRSKPSLVARVLKKIPNSTKVTVVSRGTKWTKVRYAGVTGFCATKYLKFGG